MMTHFIRRGMAKTVSIAGSISWSARKVTAFTVLTINSTESSSMRKDGALLVWICALVTPAFVRK